jgi:hypothetical protein
LGGTTCNNIATQVSCSNGMSPNSATHDWNTDVFASGPWNGQYFCGNSPIGYEVQHVIVTPNMSATGSHTITVTQQAIDASQNPLGTAQVSSYTFNVVTVTTLPQTTPSSYPPIANNGLATWQYQVAGTGISSSNTPGYVYEANQYIANQTASPGAFFNDSVGAVEADLWLGFYDAGRFAAEFGDILTNCGSPSQPISCPVWTTGAKTQGQILNNGSCFLDVITAGNSAGSAPACPGSVGGTVTDGTAVEMNIGTATWWYDFAQNIGDQYRNTMDLGQQWLAAREWGIFPVALEKFAFRRNVSVTNTPDANAVQFILSNFITGNGATLANKLTFDGWMPTGTVRALPLNGLSIAMWWYLSGSEPISGGGVHMLDRWVDIALQYVDELTSCSVTGNIGVGYPNCAPGVQLSSQNFDAGLILEFLQKACTVQQTKGSGCNISIPPAVRTLADWLNSQQFQPIISAFGVYSQPYSTFGVPETTHNVDFQQSALLNMPAPTLAWLGNYCGNCTLPTSGTPVWTVADQYFSHSYDAVSLAPKQYGQLMYGMSSFIHWRTSPSNGGWGPYQDSATPALNPYQSNWPNLLGPYPQGTEPSMPVCTPGGSGAATCTWYSAPAATPYVRYAVAPADPWAGTKVTGSQGACNAQANICLNTVSLSGLPSDVYNLVFGGTDSAGNTAQSGLNWNLGHGFFQVTITGTSLSITGTLADGLVGVPYSSTLGAANGTPPYTFTTVFCTGAACAGGSNPNVAGLTMNPSGTYGGGGQYPTKVGGASVSVTVTDSLGNHTTKPFSLSIGAVPSSGGIRGELRGEMR